MYSEDMTGHAIIGEAAVNLAVREQEITVDTLMTELKVMLKAEKLSDSRSRRISDAISWLHDFRAVSTREVETQGWMLPDADKSGASGEATIRLQADSEDEIR